MTCATPMPKPSPHQCPAVVMADSSVLVQTVTRSASPWLHALLAEVERALGIGMLISAPFRPRGALVSTIHEALHMAVRDRRLQYVVVEDYVFQPPGLSAECLANVPVEASPCGDVEGA